LILLGGVAFLSPVKRAGARLARVGKLADGAHQPVLYLLPKQKRELPNARSVGASR
jgi:hypothetical protein